MRAAMLSLLCLCLISCSGPTAPQGASPLLRAFVSIPPQASFVERIGGPFVAVGVMVLPGQSPHAYEPTPRQMVELSQADVYFEIGLLFEQQLLARARAINPRLRVVDTREGIALHPMDGADLHEHGAGQPDPHIWLSPKLAKIQAATIAEALCSMDPAHAPLYRQNLAAFQADLDRVDAAIAASLAPLRGKPFFVYHPAFWYFGDAYGLRQIPVEIDGKEPSARQLAALIERARAAGVRVIFVQPEFPAKSAEAVAAAIGGSVVKINDLSRDYLANLETIAAKIREGIGNGGPAR